MTCNHQEYNNDINLENLKCSVQIYWGCTFFAEKLTKELEVIKLAFSNFLHNNNFQLLFIFFRTVFMHWEFCLCVLPSAVYSCKWKKKVYQFYNDYNFIMNL